MLVELYVSFQTSPGIIDQVSSFWETRSGDTELSYLNSILHELRSWEVNTLLKSRLRFDYDPNEYDLDKWAWNLRSHPKAGCILQTSKLFPQNKIFVEYLSKQHITVFGIFIEQLIGNKLRKQNSSNIIQYIEENYVSICQRLSKRLGRRLSIPITAINHVLIAVLFKIIFGVVFVTEGVDGGLRVQRDDRTAPLQHLLFDEILESQADRLPGSQQARSTTQVCKITSQPPPPCHLFW